MPGSTSYKLTLATKSNCVRLSKDIFEKKKQKKQNQNKQRKKMGAQATSLQEKMEVHVILSIINRFHFSSSYLSHYPLCQLPFLKQWNERTNKWKTKGTCLEIGYSTGSNMYFLEHRNVNK